MAAIYHGKSKQCNPSIVVKKWSSTVWFCVWSHVGHIPDLLAQVLLPLLTSGEMGGISGGAAGGDGCKDCKEVLGGLVIPCT